MKQTLKFLAIVALSAAIAFGVACIMLAITDSEKAFAFTYLGLAIIIALAMGAFDVREKTRYESIKHKYGITKKAA